MSELEKLQRWVAESHEERRLKVEFQVIDRFYGDDDSDPEDELWFRVSAYEMEQFANREGEGDEGGYASVERVVAFEHRDLRNACSYVLRELGVAA